MKINVLLVSKLESTLNAMRKLIDDEEIAVVGESSGGVRALDKIENTSPDILIMTLGGGDPDVLNLTERVVLHKPRTFVILLAENTDAGTLMEATRAGAHNITEFPATAKEFAEYIKSVYNSETTRLNSLAEKQNITWMSRVITVFGSKGGLGKTTIATNIAVRLAQSGKKVALVDLDLQFGDIHIFLDIEPKETIAELVQDVYTPNIDSVRSYMVVHSSGVHVLCAPKSPEYSEVVSPDRVQSLLSLLRSYYDFVIIDTPPWFNEVTMTAIESSSTVLFVTGLDISILKNSKLSLSLFESLKQKDKVRVLVNRAVEINTITLNDVQRIIGCPIWAKIPSDYKVAVSALNRGVPFILGAPNTKLSQSLSDVAELLLRGDSDYDIQKLGAKEKKKLLRKYRTNGRKEVF
jgi:ATPases involved in chromosome partitioning